MRPDLEIIQQWIEPGSRVLDLGCGDGSLLTYLNSAKKVSSVGLEIDAGNIEKCIASGVNVIEQNMDEGLGNFQFGIRGDLNRIHGQLVHKHVPNKFMNKPSQSDRKGL